MSKGKKINPRRRPATQADVKRAKEQATGDGCRLAMAIFFTVLFDKGGADKETMQTIWSEVEGLSDSVVKGYVSVPDLVRVLNEEYDIVI